MNSVRLTTAIGISLAIILLALGCGSGSGLLPDALPDSVVSEQYQLSGELPGIAVDVAHLASAAGDFLPQQDGVDYASDLATANVNSHGSNVVFDASVAAPGSPIAYCLYRLELAASPSVVDLELTWVSAAPDDYWVALANWDAMRWDWYDAGSLSVLNIADAAPYSGMSDHCFAAVVVLDNLPKELISIGFDTGAVIDDGYTLFAPLQSNTTFLIDTDGTTVHTWDSAWSPGNSVELTEDGYLLHTCMLNNPDFTAGGTGGRIEKLDWDGSVVWEYTLSSIDACQHHDFELLPNGNILLVVWQRYHTMEAVLAGRNPANIPDGEVWADSIIEIKPVGASGTVVWEWYLWDHLVQDFDSMKSNFGVVADHPELVDINFGPPTKDWNHVNSVDYNEELDQIAISVHNLNELWIIDHSTTTAEAASHAGGSSGHGGDLLYRWGNPRAYDAGLASDQLLFGQHDVQWIADGLDGAGNLLLYNNGMNRPGDDYSNIFEIATPVQPDGSYTMSGGKWGPLLPVWEYMADPPTDFFSNAISGVQRLASGNTLICCGNPGWFFEVDSAGVIQWEYQNTVGVGPLGAPVFRCTRYSADYPGLSQL